MTQYPWKFFGSALLAAWSIDFLFWGKSAGISLPIWFVIAIGAGVFLALTEKRRLSFPAWLLIGGVLLLAAVPFFRVEPFTRLAALTGALLGLMLLTDTLLNGWWPQYRLRDYFFGFFRLIWAAISRPFSLFKTDTPPLPPSKEKGTRSSILPIFRGVLLALPVVAVLAALLASADPIFNDQVQQFFSIFKLDNFTEYLFRFIYILVFAYIFLGVFLHAVNPDRPLQQPDPRQPWFTPFLGFTEGAIILSAVTLLFTAFVIIQFRYFFGGQVNITTVGYTYAEYARRGFGELVAVAVLTLLLYLGLASITRMVQPRQRWGFAALSTALVALVLVILVSALRRMLLYENAYGFTQLRTYTHVFILALAALLIATILMELLNQRGRFALTLLIICFGFCLALAVVNIDGFIAHQNLARARQGENLDAAYLKSLSVDAVPALIQEYAASQPTDSVYQPLGIELACRAANLSQQSPRAWQSFQLSELSAARLLKQNAPSWAQFPTHLDTAGGWQVTANGVEQPCVVIPGTNG